MAGFNLSKIVSGVNGTLNFVNRAIPIYKQVTPVIKNVRSAFSTVSSIKEASKEAKVKELMLTHLWPEEKEKHYLKEAKKEFKKVILAKEGKIKNPLK